MIICRECGRIIEYRGELSDAALSMLGMTRAEAAYQESRGLCEECQEDMMIDSSVEILDELFELA